MEHFHLLPYQKEYHIFMFSDLKSILDRLWVSDVIKNLEYCGYKGACTSDDFDIQISVFKNIQRKVQQSIITAFVISENALKSKAFTKYMEIAVMLITESDEENTMVPILLNDCEMPICLRNYRPLNVTDRREDWWPTLIRVLENHAEIFRTEARNNRIEHFYLLPFQKKYHIFMFNDLESELDRFWVRDVIKNLEYSGYKGGCTSDDFDIQISVFQNIPRKINQSIITAFVISENALKSKAFTNYMEIAVMLIIESGEKNPMVPILLNDCEMPICLRNYHPLNVTDRREDWLPTLIRVLENHVCSSSSGESDEDTSIRNLIEEWNTKCIEKQRKFRQLCKQSGITQLTSQMETRTMLMSVF